MEVTSLRLWERGGAGSRGRQCQGWSRVPHGGVGARPGPALGGGAGLPRGCCSRHPLAALPCCLVRALHPQQRATLGAWRLDPALVCDTSLISPPFTVLARGLLAADAGSCPPPCCRRRSPPLRMGDWDVR